ncbi:D-glycero-beta-D-manno-heptose 1,7-bisphosphate 7-phosphatase [Candidatus Vallotiella sp. (ex Adelges kitamiensis)]|uniref:D-glycero-beta-D-manno-heptose 1,7-bisphosphate 7-phosphatase n=1 Tax=Candidatus Vallotiella sp. (ex Adelges kitamiensis) TaxID=2864217 RepID=UPI001CE290EE|nr:D-glycero-beta-D-manno-heptose 1,7-bisphosphate 7-phosphatase [Candidatus Vallotia sp. (ex Adelges kitamiensis)]
MSEGFIFSSRPRKLTTPKKLVILDRDGVINYDSDAFIKSPDEWVPIPGSLEAIVRLNQSGYHVVVASNQSAIGRGLFNMATLNEIHKKMNHELAALGGQVAAIFFCPHTPADHCDCRKPKLGLFIQIIQRFQIDSASTPMVGDSQHDLQAALALGLRRNLVLTGKGSKTLGTGNLPVGTTVYSDLHAFVLDFCTTVGN